MLLFADRKSMIENYDIRIEKEQLRKTEFLMIMMKKSYIFLYLRNAIRSYDITVDLFI
jgi:hypothetical protein